MVLWDFVLTCVRNGPAREDFLLPMCWLCGAMSEEVKLWARCKNKWLHTLVRLIVVCSL